MNKSESKYFNTAVRMDEALLSLLETKDFPYITVKEICEAAQVNRSTFYLHYETIGDLLTETLDYLNQRFLGYFQEDTQGTLEKLRQGSLQDLIFITPEYLVPYLTFIRDNRRLFVAAITRPEIYQSQAKYEHLYQVLFGPIFDRFSLPEAERTYTLQFYLHGIVGVLMEWIRSGCSTDIPQMSRLLTKLILGESPL